MAWVVWALAAEAARHRDTGKDKDTLAADKGRDRKDRPDRPDTQAAPVGDTAGDSAVDMADRDTGRDAPGVAAGQRLRSRQTQALLADTTRDTDRQDRRLVALHMGRQAPLVVQRLLILAALDTLDRNTQDRADRLDDTGFAAGPKRTSAAVGALWAAG